MRNIPAGPQHRNHPPGVMVIYSPGDPPQRTRENDSSPHTATLEGSGGPTVSVLPSMDSWLVPTRRGTVDKQLSPACQGQAWVGVTHRGRVGLV